MAKKEKPISELLSSVAGKIKARPLSSGDTPRPNRLQWPVECTVGPGLEGAIACESKVGYVDGSKGRVLYRGYDISDLCANSTFEEVCYLLLHGSLPSKIQLETFKSKLVRYRHVPSSLRMLMSFPVEKMHPMAALRLASDLLRQRLTWRDQESARPASDTAIASDEDSISMETPPTGERHAIYEFKQTRRQRPPDARKVTSDATQITDCMRLIAAMPTLCAAIKRVREHKLPIEPDGTLGHSANFLYMMSGRKPTEEETRAMDVSLILHADHGMNASTFASMVVASTLSDIYLSIGSGISALSGPLHGGANEEVVRTLETIGSPDRVDAWFQRKLRKKEKIAGFGHRVYKTFDPRALLLAPLAKHLVSVKPEHRELYRTARALEKVVLASELSQNKKIYPNVDFYSGIVYRCLDISPELFTPVFAVSRVAGWTARVLEYLRHNRIFRPRAIYVGEYDRPYVPLEEREI